MSEPVVFISRFHIKQGALDGFLRFFREGTDRLKADKPGTVVFLAYVDEAGSRATIIHVFPDADAMDRHVEGAEERAREAYEFLEPAGFEIYGRPNEEVAEMMSGSGATFQRDLLAGFLRLTPA